MNTNRPRRKKFPPDHPDYFAWDLTEENKGKHLIFLGMGMNRKKAEGEKASAEESNTSDPDKKEGPG